MVQRKSPGTPCGAGHVGLTHTETQRGRLWTALRGPGQSPILAFACCVRSLLSVAAAGAPAGVVSAFAEPSGWCAGAVLVVVGVI